ncbi:hypothetical protein BUALT_Bualt03G0205600 [Buddleja alternifolia]|uniref:F-box domain-containing protein n=1 Tax=Buddleja alternifolia TaxID=168488 RepID=A0AAV6Y287_9LAMI|nr:hypothetical protein BUALT_Bualt03G0205600 [Buddleja alternifolia]
MAESTCIEDLPEGIIIHILSFLPTIYAIRASLISRKWRNLWYHIHILNFDMNLFRTPLNRHSATRDFFADFITQTLILRPNFTPIHTFRLHFDYRHTIRRRLDADSWIRHAIHSGAAVLRLDFDVTTRAAYDYKNDVTHSDNDFPDEAYESYGFHFYELKNCDSVKVLKLTCCDIVWPKSNGGNRRILTDCFSSLCSVSLDQVYLTDDDLFALVSSLVNLEYLSLSGLSPLVNFKIHSQKLKELKLGMFMVHYKGPAVGSLEISCPSLDKIRFDSFLVEEYYLKDLSSLVEASVDFFFRSREVFVCWWELMQVLRDSCVERLITPNMRFDRDCWLELLDAEDFSKCCAFENLKHLELKTSYAEDDIIGIAAFLEVCSTVESLVIDYCCDCEDNDSLSEGFMNGELITHIPNLKQVKMKNYKGTENELYLVKLLKLFNVVLREIVGVPPTVNGTVLPSIVL